MRRFGLAAQMRREDVARAHARAWAEHNKHKNQATTNQEETMSNEPTLTIVGNLTADPEMRFTPSGAAVASFTIASTPRTFDRQANQFRDGETLFMRCSIWRDAAENVAESLTKGMRVIATGRLVQRSFTTREGENRTVVEMQVDEIGPSLKYAKAQVARVQRSEAPQQSQQSRGSWSAPAGGSDADPWGQAPGF